LERSPHIVGLVAGAGRLPFALARGARRAGHRVVVVAFEGFADPALGGEADALSWVRIGALDALLGGLHAAGVREVIVAGNVPKEQLFARPEVLGLDARGAAFLAQLRDRSDDAILRGLGEALEAEGIHVAAQTAYAGELLAPAGVLGAVAPTPAQRDDVAFGWPLAKAIGRLDIGQTLVVKDRSVLAVEAIEGTDAAVRRGGALGRGRVVVLKVFKPDQDPRFDAPTIGPDTIATLAEAGAALLAVEAGRTLVLDREAVIEHADAAGIALLGVPEAGPT
jgi:UDP-2,3-diacylglucosamine hydrolase